MSGIVEAIAMVVATVLIGTFLLALVVLTVVCYLHDRAQEALDRQPEHD